MKQAHIVVIGGGAAGAAAAYQLTNLGYRVTIVERNSRLGGRIDSRSVHGVDYEMGASFITDSSYPTTFALVDQLGLKQSLQRRKSHSAVFRSGKAHSLKSLLGTGWLSSRAKTVLTSKVLKLLFIGRHLRLSDLQGAEQFDTKTVAEVFTTKNQREFMEYILQPILNGYFYWKPERTSIAMLMLLLNVARKKSNTYTLLGGLRQIPKLLAQNSHVLLSSEVTGIQKQAKGFELNLISDGAARILHADGVVCATTATVAAKLLTDLSREQASFLATVSYSSTAVIARTYERNKPTLHYALAYPRFEDDTIASISSDSGATGDNTTIEIIKTYGSGEVGRQLNEASDHIITDKLHGILYKDTLVKSTATSTSIQRWPEALPEFKLGHIKNLHSFLQSEQDNLVFAGDYIGGPYIEGAITSGIKAANRLDARLNQLAPK